MRALRVFMIWTSLGARPFYFYLSRLAVGIYSAGFENLYEQMGRGGWDMTGAAVVHSSCRQA